MEEQFLFAQVHEALDVPTPPGAYERLRTQLTKKPVQPRRWPALQMRTSKMGFRLAAGLVVVAIAVAAAAAVVAIHNSTNNVSPAGSPMSVDTYKAMTRSDWVKANSALEPCGSGTQGGCAAIAAREIPPVQRWLDDLNRAGTPGRFVIVDAEIRAHLTQEIAALRFVVNAGASSDARGIDGYLDVVGYAHTWTTVIVDAIVASQPVSEAEYRKAVKAGKVSLDNCFLCTGLLRAKNADCSSLLVASCFDLFDQLAGFLVDLQGAVVANAAPGALLAADHELQIDLARADIELIAMKLAAANRDVATFSSALERLQAIVVQIDADAAKITS